MVPTWWMTYFPIRDIPCLMISYDLEKADDIALDRGQANGQNWNFLQTISLFLLFRLPLPKLWNPSPQSLVWNIPSLQVMK